MLAKARLPRELVDAELQRMRFERVLERHPTPGHSFLDVCDVAEARGAQRRVAGVMLVRNHAVLAQSLGF